MGIFNMLLETFQGSIVQKSAFCIVLPKTPGIFSCTIKVISSKQYL